MTGESVPARSLLPGDLIWTPGGEGRVLAVVPVNGLVRLDYRDAVSVALVFLPADRPVLRRGQG